MLPPRSFQNLLQNCCIYWERVNKWQTFWSSPFIFSKRYFLFVIHLSMYFKYIANYRMKRLYNYLTMLINNWVIFITVWLASYKSAWIIWNHGKNNIFYGSNFCFIMVTMVTMNDWFLKMTLNSTDIFLHFKIKIMCVSVQFLSNYW